jgi:uncharacterized protein (TIGR01777 family)
MPTVLITGGTGLVGTAITHEMVNKGYHVIILTRDLQKVKQQPKISYAEWDVEKQTIDEKAIQSSDFIIHLAGANIAGKRWAKKRKLELVDSRVRSGALIVKALLEIPNKVQAVIAASAIGWYGSDPLVPGSRPFVENDPADLSFLGNTCQQWETAIAPVTGTGKRLVIFRMGIVLSNESGAYAEFKKPLKFGITAILGEGTQVISWIHVADIARLYLYAIENNKLHGIYNAVSPQPVSNRVLIHQMSKTTGFHLTTHVPAFVLKLLFGEMIIEVLKSTTVSSKKIEDAGFHFFFPSIESAINNLMADNKHS